MDVVNGQFDCDKKNKENICRLIYSMKFGLGYTTNVTTYCQINRNGSCPEMNDCIENQFPKTPNKILVDAINIVENMKLELDNPEKSLNKLSKADAEKLAIAINQIDVEMLKGLPSKSIKDIEEFKRLPKEEQSKIIMQPKRGPMAAAIVGGLLAATYATGWVKGAYQDSLFGGDHLRKNKTKIQKTYDEKQFDLKD